MAYSRAKNNNFGSAAMWLCLYGTWCYFAGCGNYMLLVRYEQNKSKANHGRASTCWITISRTKYWSIVLITFFLQHHKETSKQTEVHEQRNDVIDTQPKYFMSVNNTSVDAYHVTGWLSPAHPVHAASGSEERHSQLMPWLMYYWVNQLWKLTVFYFGQSLFRWLK